MDVSDKFSTNPPALPSASGRTQVSGTVHCTQQRKTLHPGSECYNRFEIMLSGVGSTYTRSVVNKIYKMARGDPSIKVEIQLLLGSVFPLHGLMLL